MFEKIKKFFVISRPISWLNTAYPFAAGYIISGGVVDATFIIGTLYFLGPYNLLMYGVNDVFDYESDIRNPRKGGIEGAVTAKSFHPTILWACALTNLPFLVALAILGTPLSSLVLAIVVFFVLAYSIAKLRFKERPVLDSITSSMHFVGPLLFALSLFGLNASSLPFVIAFFFWGMASHAFGAVQDIIPDREGGLSSIATVLGARRTTYFSLVLYIISVILISTQGLLPTIVGIASLVYVINVIPYLKVTDKTSALTRPGWRRFIWLNLFVGFVVTMVLITKTPFGN
jgi:4-hydroxybenzoate polyprenyltransferase